jgi:tRNA dimethylallyltransferase
LKKTCIIIVGPTAVGKTALAVQLAQHFSTDIISADSRQCFKELNIGVAKPSRQELDLVKHYFINSQSIHDTVNTAIFERYALAKSMQIFKKHDFAVMVGGTGLYVKTFVHGIDEIPVIQTAIREKIMADYEWEGLACLQAEVEKNDALYFAKGEIKNPQRLMRALEVKLSTGKSIVEFQTQQLRKRDFDIITIGLEIPREDLHKRINGRVDDMLKHGLLAEVKSLVAYKDLNAMQTVGYREMFGHLAGDLSLQEATEAIKINTRQYAKRQMTWFKKDETIYWTEPLFDKTVDYVNHLLNKNQ